MTLEEKLSEIFVPDILVTCTDVKCKNPEHCELVDKLTCDVLGAVQTAADISLPCPGGVGNVGRKSLIPGWSDAVKPFKDNAFFWHQVCQGVSGVSRCVRCVRFETYVIVHQVCHVCQMTESKPKIHEQR